MNPLFQASYRGRPVTVDHATDDELTALSTASILEHPRDTLVFWSFVALRNVDCQGSRVHALGWRSGLANTWATSRLAAVDSAAEVVKTFSGHGYRLHDPDCRWDLRPELRAHLEYALRTWGFVDVR